MRPEPASDFTDFVYHALAHLYPRDASSTWEPAYLSWAARTLPCAALSPLTEHAALLTALYDSHIPNARLLHALPRLHDSIAHFLTSAARPLAALRPENVRDAHLLDALRKLDESLVELLRADLALAARAYREAHRTLIHPEIARACERTAPWLEEAQRALPSFRLARVELACALGPRGRALGSGRIVVGASLPWNAMDPAWSAVQALHEHAVSEAYARGAGSFARAEWHALESLALAMTHAGGALAEAHAAWVGNLALDVLAHDAVREGAAPQDEAMAVAHQPTQRQQLLATMAARHMQGPK